MRHQGGRSAERLTSVLMGWQVRTKMIERGHTPGGYQSTEEGLQMVVEYYWLPSMCVGLKDFVENI